jgi:hypothetical protein
MEASTVTSVPFPSLPRSFRLALLGLIWLALTVYFHSPVREVLTPSLDGSNFASYSYFTARGFQYGAEVVPMAGPYGFIMYGRIYSGELFWTRTICELILNGALAALTLWFMFRHRGSWWSWVWLASHLAFTPFIEDLPIEWLLLLSGFYVLQTPPRPGFAPGPGLATGLIAFLSLVKGTQFFLGVATLGVLLGCHLWQRHWRHAGVLGACYLISLLLFWSLAGQNPLNLPAYIRGMIELGGGYTDAMSLDAPGRILIRGLLVSAGLVASLGWALWLRRREPVAIAGLLLLAGYSFVEWKHGFVRADGHAFIYFHYAMVAALTIFLLASWPPTERTGRATAIAGLLLLVATIAPACFSRDDPMLPSLRQFPGSIWHRFTENLAHLRILPGAKARFESQLARQRQEFALPAVRDQVHHSTIDNYGFEHGLIPLNGLKYHPRPMGGGSFNAYTPMLLRLNRDFVRDPARRPDFYLVKLQTIDGRLLAQDDGLALHEIIQHYRPVLFEHEHLLMQALPATLPPEPRLIARHSFKFGEPVIVPTVGNSEMLLARFVLKNNWRGRLRALLYKTPAVFIRLHDRNGADLGSRRLIPSMAASPFVFSPWLETFDDLVALYDHSPARPIGGFTLATTSSAYFTDSLSVEFQVVPRPVQPDSSTLHELRSRLHFPFANIIPESITPAFRPHPSVRFLHPPAEALWKLSGDEREVTFHYGIDPQAYENGTTNGVEFIVEIRGPSGGVSRVFSRTLKPLTHPADRGDQAARITLPVYAEGSRLALRTDPGEYGDNAWDWAYFSRMEIRPGRFAPDQFPGFSLVPDAAEGEHVAAIEFEGRKMLLLHVPGSVDFNLTGREKALTLDFGFLPGAYTNEGRTAGADYVVELRHAGQSQQIFRRELRPVSEVADRGLQTATIKLPALAAGDILRVRTATPATAGNSWGWTYIARLVIE